jgi:hypothetical protein
LAYGLKPVPFKTKALILKAKALSEFFGKLLVGLLVFLVLLLVFVVWPVVLLRSRLRWGLRVLARLLKGTRRGCLPVLVLRLWTLRRRRVLLRWRRGAVLTLWWPLLLWRRRDLPILLRRRNLTLVSLRPLLLRRRVVLRRRWPVLRGRRVAARLSLAEVRPVSI